MNTKLSRSAKAEIIAVLLLGALIALLLVTPTRAAEPFRLDRLAIVRPSLADDGRLLLRHGVLDLSGAIAWRATRTIARPANLQEWVIDRDLVNVNAWLAFRNLGGEATANFEILEGAVHVPIADEVYMAVGISPEAQGPAGTLINLSTRTLLSPGQTVIAGFVIEGRPRTVLVRAVGPSLARFGVVNALPDPRLTLQRAGGTIAGNDNWTQQAEPERVMHATARVAAFPLDPGSLDAAQVLKLSPGAYTVHVGTDLADVRDREVLIEIYGVPEDVFD
jgi:hypothetical protein